MTNEPESDPWDSRDDRDRQIDAETFRIAKQKVSVPAKLLITASVLMILLALANVAAVASGTDQKWQVQMLEYFEQQQPPGQAKDDLKKQIEEVRTRDRTPEYIQSAIFITLGLTLDILILVGGVRMNNLSGRTMATVGAICAILPINSCCCIGMPLGIWALIVLSNADVKAAFEASKVGGSSPPFADDLR